MSDLLSREKCVMLSYWYNDREYAYKYVRKDDARNSDARSVPVSFLKKTQKRF